jgi:uncharacterized phiE125 gp8 family phage protein
MALRLITAPAREPLDLELDVKPHLRVDFADDDNYINTLQTAVREYVEVTELSGSLISQTWELVLDTWPTSPLYFPKPPLQSVTSITYTDIDGGSAVVSSSAYLVDADSWPGRLVLRDGQSWPSVTLQEIGGVVIRFVAGYGSAVEDVPAPIRQAMLLILSDWYENRENTLIVPGVGVIPPMPFAARQLLASYRRRQF